MALDPTRLYTALLNTGLQQKNNPLYQVIHDLIANLALVSRQVGTSGSGSTINTTVFETNIIQSLGLLGEDGIDGDVGFPGPAGINGSAGPAGISTALGPPGLDGVDGEDGLILGTQGPQGIQGITGSQGPVGPVIILEDGLDGDLGPIGPIGVTGSQGPIGPSVIPEDIIEVDILPMIPSAQPDDFNYNTLIGYKNFELPANESIVSVRTFLVNLGQHLTLDLGSRFRII